MNRKLFSRYSIFILFFIFIFIIFGCFYFLIYKKNDVYVINNIFTKNECKNIINYSEYYNKWTIYENNGYFTIDILIKNLPKIEKVINNIINNKIIPEFEAKYNIPKNSVKIDENELFVIKYYNEKTKAPINNIIKYHKDPLPFSFNIALNDDFDGGGTHFLDQNIYVNNPVGSCLIFPGEKTHSGIKINYGIRYIIYGSLKL